MTVVLKDENNLTFCFRQENQYPIPFVCKPVDVLPWNITCKKIFEYHKNLYTPTFTFPTTTTTPISSTMTEKVTSEEKDHEADQWKVATFAKYAIGIFVFVFAMLIGAALCYIVLSVKPKVTTMNEYDKTPKAPEGKSLTGTSRETEV
uniref:Uncharacterized protein n=1 Tax=Panagrolaimus davidi TaxID=227884 RepID=A0A914QX95_9BILA